MLFLTVLFVIVSLLLAYALSADKGKNSIHARRHATHTSSATITALPKKAGSKPVSVN